VKPLHALIRLMLDDLATKNHDLTGHVDGLLHPYLMSRGEPESSEILERLICDFAQPIIREIVSFKLRLWPSGDGSGSDRQDAEDICSDVTLRLMNRLHDLKQDPINKPISNLRSYFAVMTYNACDEYLRKRYPERHRLKSKIRYLLSRQKGFALWESADGPWLAGYTAWRNDDWSRHRTWDVDTSDGDPGDLLEDLAAALKPGQIDLAALVDEVFNRTARPVELDALVTAVAYICGIKDQPAEAAVERDRTEAFADPRIALDQAMDNQVLVSRLWLEICSLPLKQKSALLLNLKDSQGSSVLTLLPRIRVASIRDIAQALEIDPEDMAAIWNQLPIEDAVIAGRLQVTRQQVINLRKSARERLARRLKAHQPMESRE
jgi:DNA-directed RNA polymerase specialized sigma24 family protein